MVLKNNYSIDIEEVFEILSVLFNPCKNFENAKYVINKLSVKTNNAFLDDRGKAYGIYLNKEEILVLLESLYKEYCCSDRCSDCPIAKYCNSYINSKIKEFDATAPKMVDLFCGAGGLSLGFAQNGFITSLANDIEPCCIDTYSHNHPETPRENIILGDINNVISNIDSLLRFKDVDIVIGGPPCQGFSMANRQRIIDDPRNKLYKSYVKVLTIVRPKFFVMENVKGMMSVVSQILEDFQNIGYSVSYRLLNAKDFGIPQNRERLIFIGNRLGLNNDLVFKDITNQSKSIQSHVLEDALLGLRPLKALDVKNATERDSEESGRKIDRFDYIENSYLNLINMGNKPNLVFNHKARYNNERDIEIYRRLCPGDKSDDPKIADIMPYSRRNGIFRDKYFKLEPNKICKTITAHMKCDCNMYIHPSQARGLTPREAARIQSFPDNYYFRGSFTKTYMQIGNSVPPLLGRVIAAAIKNFI